MGTTATRQYGASITYSGRLTVTTCWCGIPHAVPEELYDFAHRRKNDSNVSHPIFCPLGHEWVISGESELDRTKKALEREQNIARNRLERLENEREATAAERRSHAATKGHQTRLKNRIAKGVCPCCSRHFPALNQHMKSEHPEFTMPETT